MVETVALAAIALAGLVLLQRAEKRREVAGAVRGAAPARRRLRRGALVAALGWSLAAILLLPHAMLLLDLLRAARGRGRSSRSRPSSPLPTGSRSSRRRSGCGRSSTRSGWRRPRRPRRSCSDSPPPGPPSRGEGGSARTLESLDRDPVGSSRDRLRRRARGDVLRPRAAGRAASCSSGPPRSCRSRTSSGTFRSTGPRRVRRPAPARPGARGGGRVARRAAGRGGSGAIVLPLLRPALAAGASIAFITALGDFVVSIVLYTFETRPISIEILSSLRTQETGVGAAYGVLLARALGRVVPLLRDGRAGDGAAERLGILSTGDEF